MICLCIAQRWLYKLGHKYKDVHKDVFINRHKQPDVIEDCKVFLEKLEELKPYMVEFNKNDIMKTKVYLSNCIIRGNNRQPIIIITHNEYIFSANNRIWKAWAWKSDTFLHLKDWDQGIIVSKFIFLYMRLNLVSFTPEKIEKVV